MAAAPQPTVDAQLARILEHIRAKVQNKAKHPYHSIKMINDVIKSPADLKKALEKYMVALSDPQWGLLLSAYPATPSPANKGQIFDFMRFADAVFPPPAFAAVSKHEVFLEGSTRARGASTQQPAAAAGAAGPATQQQPAQPQPQQPLGQTQQPPQAQTLLPPEVKADATMGHGIAFEVPNSPPHGGHLHAPPQIVTVPPSKYHTHCLEHGSSIIGPMSHKVDHHKDAGPHAHKKKLTANLHQKPKFTTFPISGTGLSPTKALMTQQPTS